MLVKIDKHNIPIFENLAQAYEAEFSNLTLKKPNEFGLFSIDTMPHPPYVGYLLFCENVPVGFCLANIESKIKDVADFYIIPSMRKQNFGYELAESVFNRHPGEWYVRQIEGATHAIAFWRKVIKKYTNDHYEESKVQDPDWGMVTRQHFHSI